MQQEQTNPTQGLGIAGIIVGIFSIFFAIIPCTIFLGIILGVIGLILTIIGLNQASKLNAQKGLLIAGLISSIIGNLADLAIEISARLLLADSVEAVRGVFRDVNNVA